LAALKVMAAKPVSITPQDDRIPENDKWFFQILKSLPINREAFLLVSLASGKWVISYLLLAFPNQLCLKFAT
jgi:hypothetical protein